MNNDDENATGRSGDGPRDDEDGEGEEHQEDDIRPNKNLED